MYQNNFYLISYYITLHVFMHIVCNILHTCVYMNDVFILINEHGNNA